MLPQQQQQRPVQRPPYLINAVHQSPAKHPMQRSQQQQQQWPLISPPGLGNGIRQSPAKSPMRPSMENLMQRHHAQQQQQQLQYFRHPIEQLYMQGPHNHPPPGMTFFPFGIDPFFPQAGHPQMLPHFLFNQHAVVNNIPPHQACPLPNPHFAIAMNNFAMHPNFDAIHASAAGEIHSAVFIAPPQGNLTFGHAPPPPRGQRNQVRLLYDQTVQYNPNGNMFNMHLMQEIQQNHPIPQNANSQGYPSQNLHQPPIGVGSNNLQIHAQQQNTPFASHLQKQQNYNARNDNLPPEKCNNQLYHPLTQSKNPAQMVLVQVGKKNGTRKGQQRESNLENYHGGNNNNNIIHDLSLPPHISNAWKFKKPLDKVQYGSVTAPRKNIDAAIVNTTTITTGTGANNVTEQNGNQTGLEAALPTDAGAVGQISSSAIASATLDDLNAANKRKKYDFVWFHIENLYRLILQLDDLDKPNAIATVRTKGSVANNSPWIWNFYYEIETKATLLEKLIAGLQFDKIVSMMNMHNGKVLIKRIMPYIEQSEVRWEVWSAVFNALPNVFKKDHDDVDGALYALHPEFKKQIKVSNFRTVVKMSWAFTLSGKRAYSVFCTKFGFSSLVCLIIQAERIYTEMVDPTLTYQRKRAWRQFLVHVAFSLRRTIRSQMIYLAMDRDAVEPMRNHFARFKDLKLNSLLALVTQAKDEIY